MLRRLFQSWPRTSFTNLLIVAVLVNYFTTHHTAAAFYHPVCARTASVFLVDISISGPAVKEGIAMKPIGVPSNSLCAGMKGTCCKPSLEPELLQAMERSYNRRYLTALQKRISPLFTAGRRLNRAIFKIFADTKVLLVKEVAKVMNKSKDSTEDLFTDMFDHIYKLVHTKDLCFLLNEVNTTIRMIFNDVYVSQWQKGRSGVDTTTTNITECISDIEEAIVSMWYRPILKQLAPTLNNIKMIAESFDAINTVSLALQRNKFSDSCLRAMFTIKSCAVCGGYHRAVACDGHCLNVMRGCMSEAVELTPRIKILAGKVKDLSRFISHQLSPVLLTADTMSIFLSLAKHIKTTLSKMVVDKENCTTVLPYSNTVLDQDRYSLYATAMSSYTAPKDHESIAHLVEKELAHFTTLEAVIMELPEEVCSVDPQLLKYIRNRDCWNGTAWGSYKHSLAGHFEVDQTTNPAFKSKELVFNGQYRRLSNKMKRLTQAVDYLVSLYECLESDDEDCEYRIHLTCSARPTGTVTQPTSDPENGQGSGKSVDASGSGDMFSRVGSGGGNDSSQFDTENLQGTKRRIVIISDLKQNRFGNPSGTEKPHSQLKPTDPDTSPDSDDVVDTLKHNSIDDSDEDVDYDTGETPSIALPTDSTASTNKPSSPSSTQLQQSQDLPVTPSGAAAVSSFNVLITLAVSVILTVYFSDQLL